MLLDVEVRKTIVKHYGNLENGIRIINFCTPSSFQQQFY